MEGLRDGPGRVEGSRRVRINGFLSNVNMVLMSWEYHGQSVPPKSQASKPDRCGVAVRHVTNAAWGSKLFFAFVTLVRHGRSGRPGSDGASGDASGRPGAGQAGSTMPCVLSYRISYLSSSSRWAASSNPDRRLAGPPLKNGVALHGPMTWGMTNASPDMVCLAGVPQPRL